MSLKSLLLPLLLCYGVHASAAVCPAPGDTVRTTLPDNAISWEVNDSGEGYFGVSVKLRSDIAGMLFTEASVVNFDDGRLLFAFPLKTGGVYNGNVEFSFLASRAQLSSLQLNLFYQNDSVCPDVDYIYTASFLAAE